MSKFKAGDKVKIIALDDVDKETEEISVGEEYIVARDLSTEESNIIDTALLALGVEFIPLNIWENSAKTYPVRAENIELVESVPEIDSMFKVGDKVNIVTHGKWRDMAYEFSEENNVDNWWKWAEEQESMTISNINEREGVVFYSVEESDYLEFSESWLEAN